MLRAPGLWRSSERPCAGAPRWEQSSGFVSQHSPVPLWCSVLYSLGPQRVFGVSQFAEVSAVRSSRLSSPLSYPLSPLLSLILSPILSLLSPSPLLPPSSLLYLLFPSSRSPLLLSPFCPPLLSLLSSLLTYPLSSPLLSSSLLSPLSSPLLPSSISSPLLSSPSFPLYSLFSFL